MPASESGRGGTGERTGKAVVSRSRPRGPLIGALVGAGLAAAHALLLGFSLPPANAWALAFVAPIPLFLLAAHLGVRHGRGARAYRRAAHGGVFVVGVATWLVLHRWMTDVTGPGWFALAIYMALWWNGFVLAAGRLARAVPAWIALPVAWTGLEVLRAELAFDGYPWFLAGQPLVEAPRLVQGAAIVGWIYPSVVATVVAGALVSVVRPGAARPARAARSRVVAVAVLAVALVGTLVHGTAVLVRADARSDARSVRLLLVQTNLPQSNKLGWSFEQQQEDATRFAGMTLDAVAAARDAGTPPDLFCWPETMLPGPGLEPATLDRLVAAGLAPRTAFARLAVDLARAAGTPGLYGSAAIEGLDFADDGAAVWDRHTNAAYLVLPDGATARADKVFLTPFGETMPYISAWPWLERRLLAFGAGGMSFELDAGDEPVVLALPAEADAPGDTGTVRLGVPICFEITMARVCRRIAYADGRKRADVLVNLTNDGWFGEFDAGREQHFQLARLRAIENRVPVVRVANTGLSGWIDQQGVVRRTLGAGDGASRYGTGRRAGTLLVDVVFDDRRAPAARIAPLATWLPPIVLAVLLLVPGTAAGRSSG